MVRIIPPVCDHVVIYQKDQDAGLQAGGAHVRETLFIFFLRIENEQKKQ